jgi:iron complex outermembrane receptor protein
MNRILLAFVFTGLFLNTHAQNNKASISIGFIDKDSKSIEDVSLRLLNAPDSSLVKIALTDSAGKAIFENIGPGNYFINASSFGFANYSTPVFSIDSSASQLNFPPVILTAVENSLGEVSVVQKKPFIERHLDKLVLNVENSITSMGNSVLDVLERAPGVIVANGTTINLRGKTGVIIQLDGKPSALTGQDMVNYLRTLPSANVEKIEIITNPSAKYDAAGNAGIINIKFKKDKRQGFNGNISLSAGQGVYFKPTAATNLNWRKKKWNLFANYSWTKPNGFTHFYINRKFFDSTHAVKQIFDQDSYIKQPFENNTGKFGVDFYANDKTIIGAVISGNKLHMTRDGLTKASITNAENAALYSTQTQNLYDEKRLNLFGNLNLKHTFDSTGKELTVDADYGKYMNKNGQSYLTRYYDVSNNPYLENALRTTQLGDITFLSLKADYVQPFKKGGKFEAGMKSSYVKTDNEMVLYTIINGSEAYDSSRSNHFIYNENINAAYINIAHQYKKIEFQAGLRAEQTRTNGKVVTTGQTFSRKYIYFFPSAFFNYKVNQNYTMSLSYSKRIDRPDYRQLNPLLFFADPYTYVVGDPTLKPVITHSFDLGHTIKDNYIFSMGYVQSLNTITDVFYQNDSTKVSYQTPANMQNYYQLYVSASVPISIKDWFTSNINANGYWNKYTTALQGANMVQANYSWDLNVTNNFIIGKKGWAAELSGYYQAGQVWGQFYIKNLAQITAGFQKTSKNKMSVFKLAISDITYNNRIAVVVNYQNQDFHTQRNWDSRVVTFSYVQRFGKNTVAQARRRTTGAEDLKKRANQ